MRYWRCFGLTRADPPMCSLAEMKTLSVEDVDLANLTLLAIDNARIKARKK